VQHQVEPKAAGTREEKRECEEALVVSIVYARRGLNVHAPSRYNFKGGQLRLLCSGFGTCNAERAVGESANSQTLTLA
jgi:hypothetical protein